MGEGFFRQTSHIYPPFGPYADEREMLEVPRTLYGVLGLPLPEDVEQLAGHPEARGTSFFRFCWAMTTP